MCTKLSLCLVYRHLFQRASSRLARASRHVNALTAFLVTTYYSAALLVSVFQCTPVSKAWHPKTPGHCVNLNSFRYVTAVVNIATSVLVITTPLPVLFRVRRKRREVGEVIFLILLGVV